jgi:hypothetical protein
MKAPHGNNGAESPTPRGAKRPNLKKIANWVVTKLERPVPLWTISLLVVGGLVVVDLVWRSASLTGRDHLGERWTSAVLPESITDESAKSKTYFINLLSSKVTDIFMDQSTADNASPSDWLEPRVAVYSIPAVSIPSTMRSVNLGPPPRICASVRNANIRVIPVITNV